MAGHPLIRLIALPEKGALPNLHQMTRAPGFKFSGLRQKAGTDFLQSCGVLLGGGQDASQVTTTSSKAGGFEARFFHKKFYSQHTFPIFNKKL
eukprot:320094-Pelagomonas_calceolata.AAC.2